MESLDTRMGELSTMVQIGVAETRLDQTIYSKLPIRRMLAELGTALRLITSHLIETFAC